MTRDTIPRRAAHEPRSTRFKLLVAVLVLSASSLYGSPTAAIGPALAQEQRAVSATADMGSSAQPHVNKDPRKDAWPKPTAAEMKSVQDLIDAGKNLEALARLVQVMKNYCCNFGTMAGGLPEYDPRLRGEGSCQRRKGGKVKIGRAAFSSAAWLYSSLKHEMVHSAQWQDEEAAGALGSNGREKEAYGLEIAQAGNTGISEQEKKELEERLKHYQ
jgi:hypothetical protein